MFGKPKASEEFSLFGDYEITWFWLVLFVLLSRAPATNNDGNNTSETTADERMPRNEGLEKKV